MSEIQFHKSVYAARSTGYKYRTLSTNTGAFKPKDIVEDNAFERIFQELRNAIIIRVDREVAQTHQARDAIIEKFTKLDAEINSMLQLQNTVTALRKDLVTVTFTLANILNKVEKIETNFSRSDMFSLQSHMTTFKCPAPIMEEDDHDSVVTHI